MTTTIFTSTYDASFHDTHGSIANAKDVTIGINIIPFSGCKCTPSKKCTPVTQGWQNTAQGEIDKGQQLLAQHSFFVCSAGGGIVTFVDPGQKRIIVEGQLAVVTGAKITCPMAK